MEKEFGINSHRVKFLRKDEEFWMRDTKAMKGERVLKCVKNSGVLREMVFPL